MLITLIASYSFLFGTVCFLANACLVFSVSLLNESEQASHWINLTGCLFYMLGSVLFVCVAHGVHDEIRD